MNIFNLSELDDLPEDLVKELTVSTKDKFSTRILELFTLKNPLNVDEVTVAYYRRYSESKSRGAIHVKLYNMSRSEKYNIEAIKGRKGVYKLTAKPTITEGMRV